MLILWKTNTELDYPQKRLWITNVDESYLITEVIHMLKTEFLLQLLDCLRNLTLQLNFFANLVVGM